jgi:dipeptidyl aminopeptidase/acylaminoacyl peptidase
MGVETKLIVYPSMGHGISKPRQFHRCIQETLDWFSHWLFSPQENKNEHD